MKKILRIALSLLLIAALAFCLAACGKSRPKTFSFKGLNITVTSVFREMAQEDYAFALDSGLAAVFGLQETFEEYPQTRSMSVKRYAEITANANGKDNTTDVETVDGIPVFEFTADNDGVTYKYLAASYKNADGFWLVQFASREEDYDALKEAFLNYAKSVTFDKPFDEERDGGDPDDDMNLWEAEELSLLLPWEYSEANLEGFTASFQNDNSAVLLRKDRFDNYENVDLSAYSVDQYAEATRRNNAEYRPSELERTEGGVTYYEYTYIDEEEGENYSYLTAVYKSDEAFWLVQFASGEKDYEDYRDLFLQLADKVSVEPAD